MEPQPRSILKSSRLSLAPKKSVTWAELPTPELTHMARYLLKSLKPTKQRKNLSTSTRGLKRPYTDENKSSNPLKRHKSFKSSAEFNLVTEPQAGDLTFEHIFSGSLSPCKTSSKKSHSEFAHTPEDTDLSFDDIFSGNWSPSK